jgi:hypothetical protein
VAGARAVCGRGVVRKSKLREASATYVVQVVGVTTVTWKDVGEVTSKRRALASVKLMCSGTRRLVQFGELGTGFGEPQFRVVRRTEQVVWTTEEPVAKKGRRVGS